STSNCPFLSRAAMADHRGLTAHSTRMICELLCVTSWMYVNVRSREICCCSVMVADGVFDPPVICGSIFSLLTPNNRCSRPETGLATDAPNSVDAPVCPRLCGGATG